MEQKVKKNSFKSITKISLDDLDHFIAQFCDSVNIDFNINSVSSEVAMGLTGGIVDFYSELEKALIPKYIKNESLCYELINNTQAHWFERVVAGNILAIQGDNRIGKFPEFVQIEGGKASFGTPFKNVKEVYERYRKFGVQENWIEKECPRYYKQISSFSISKYLVTNYQYRAFMLATDYGQLPTSWTYGRYPRERSNHPVFTVTKFDAELYCKWLSEQLQEKVYLPSEEQWEFAANKGKEIQFIWGDEERIGIINTNELLLQNTSSVGVFGESNTPDGIADLLGNVEELTSTKYSSYENGKVIKDDLWLKLGNYDILKGGAFNRFFDLARIQRRHGPYPNSLYAIGFRVCI